MAKVSDLKKVEFLEKAVLDNDKNAIKNLFGEYGEFELTARALGLACRFCGSEMVSLLLDAGASFEYDMTSDMKKKYKCAIKISSNASKDLKMDYALYLFPQFILKEFDKDIIDDDQRGEVLRTLMDHQAVDINRILYYAIIYDDVLLDVLGSMGIKKFDNQWYESKKIPNLYAPYNQLNVLKHLGFLTAEDDPHTPGYHQALLDMMQSEYDTGAESLSFYDKELVEASRTELDYDEIVKIIYNFRSYLDADKIGFESSDFYSSFCDEYCSEKLFSCLATVTDIPNKVGKKSMLIGLINKGNISGIEYAFSNKWIKNRADAQNLLIEATEKNASPEVIACILKNQNELFPDSKKKGNIKRNALSANAIKVKESTWDYKELKDGTIMITSYNGQDKDVIVPSVINGKTVTAIDSQTFSTSYQNKEEELIWVTKQREEITSVEFPGSITEIPTDILLGNRNIRKVLIKEGCKRLMKYAFKNCTASEIVIADTISEIGFGAFENCRKLKTVNIPIGLTEIPSQAFGGCESLEYIELPDTVVTLGLNVFENCKALKSIKLSENLEVLPYRTFFGCEMLETLIIPNSVKEISCMAARSDIFYNCKSLKSVSLSENLKELPSDMFGGCWSLEEMVIPNSVKKVGSKLFQFCSKLRSVKLPEEIVEIPDQMFLSCEALEYVEIPEKVERVGFAIFQDCSHLRSVKLPEKIKEIPDQMFWGCKALESVEILEGVEKIGNFAFGETSIESINIPDSVTSIGYGAFLRCEKLKELTLPNATSLADEAFSGCALLSDQNSEIIVGNNYFGPYDYDGKEVDYKQYLIPWIVKSEFSKFAIPHQKVPAIIWREGAEKDTEIDITGLKTGDVIEYGRFPYDSNCNIAPIKWKVLNIENGCALLITIDEIILFNHSYYDGLISPEVGAIRWDENPIRELLNGAFYDVTFTSKEKEQIEERKLKTSNMSSSSGKKNKNQASDETKYFETTDKVFVLGKEEVTKYMSKLADRKCIATEYALKDPTWVEEPHSFKKDDQNISVPVWDLREVSESIKSEDGSRCNCKTGLDYYIRPAIWIKIK